MNNNLTSYDYRRMAAGLSVSDILNLCATDNYLNNAICNNESFWKEKLDKDYGQFDYNLFNFTSWKQLYILIDRIRIYHTGDSDTTYDFPQLFDNIKPIQISQGRNGNDTMVIDIYNNLWEYVSENYEISKTQVQGVKAKKVVFSSHKGYGMIPNYLIDTDYNLFAFIGRNYQNLNFKAKDIVFSLPVTAIIDLNDNVTLDFTNRPGLFRGSFSIKDIKVKQITVGGHNASWHLYLIDFNNDVWAFRAEAEDMNKVYKVALAGAITKDDLVQIPNIKAKQISAKSHHCLLIDMDSNVWGFGEPLSALGFRETDDDEYIDYLSPVRISNLKALKVETGPLGNSVIIDTNHNVWVFGYDQKGTLGAGRHNYDVIGITQIPNIKALDVFLQDNLFLVTF